MDEKKLQELGLNESQVKAVMAALATLQTENEKLKANAQTHEASLKELETFRGTNEALSKKLDELKERRKAETDAFKKEMAEFRKSQAIRYAVKSLKDNTPYDENIIISLLDGAKIDVDEKGNLSGFASQIEGLIKDKPFLFNSAQKAQATAGTGTTIKGVTPDVGVSANQTASEPAPLSIGARLAKG